MRRETGKEYRVQVPDNKDPANHVVPESCVSHREVRGEALTGVRIGQPLSRDSHKSRTPTLLRKWKATQPSALSASARMVWRGRRTWHVRMLLAREPGDLQSDRRGLCSSAARVGKARSRSR